MNYVLKLPIRQAVKLLEKGTEERDNERLFQMYILDRQRMDQKTYMSFTEYCERIKGVQQPINNRPKDELMEELGFIPRKE